MSERASEFLAEAEAYGERLLATGRDHTRDRASLLALIAAHEQVLAFAAALARSRKVGALQAMTERLNIVPGDAETGRASVVALEAARAAVLSPPTPEGGAGGR